MHKKFLLEFIFSVPYITTTPQTSTPATSTPAVSLCGVAAAFRTGLPGLRFKEACGMPLLGMFVVQLGSELTKKTYRTVTSQQLWRLLSSMKRTKPEQNLPVVEPLWPYYQIVPRHLYSLTTNQPYSSTLRGSIPLTSGNCSSNTLFVQSYTVCTNVVLVEAVEALNEQFHDILGSDPLNMLLSGWFVVKEYKPTRRLQFLISIQYHVGVRSCIPTLRHF